MSIGQILECPNGLDSQIPELAQSTGIRVEVLHIAEPNGRVGQYIFSTRFGRIVGRLDYKENVCRIWLTFPREHAFNPLFWMADFSLSHRIERMLCEGGVRPCVWDPLIQRS